MTVPHLPRTVRLAALAAVAGLALGGCSAFSPQTTTNVTYAPSDGVQGDVGGLGVRNLFVLTAEQGGEAELVGSLVNGSGEDASLEILVREPADGVDPAADTREPLASGTLRVDAGSTMTVGPQADEQLEIDSLDVVPGRVAWVTLTADGATLVLRAPVLDGTLPEYAELLPDEG